MQRNENMKSESSGQEFYAANQQETAALAEALERWLDDGGASDKEAAFEVGAGDFSPLQSVKPEGGLL